MSHRSVTTIKAEVTMRLPPGAKADKALEFLRSAIATERNSLPLSNPLASISTEGFTVRLTKRETSYP